MEGEKNYNDAYVTRRQTIRLGMSTDEARCLWSNKDAAMTAARNTAAAQTRGRSALKLHHVTACKSREIWRCAMVARPVS